MSGSGAHDAEVWALESLAQRESEMDALIEKLWQEEMTARRAERALAAVSVRIGDEDVSAPVERDRK